MLTCLLSLTLAVSAGQLPAESAWLNALPADTAVIAHMRGVAASRDDMAAMARAMSPTAAGQAEAILNQVVAQFTGQFGQRAAQVPFYVLLELPKPGQEGPPPFAVAVRSDDYQAVQNAIAQGGQAKPKAEPGGYDSVTGGDGQPLYTVKGDGFVAFGSSETLIGAIAAKPKTTLDTKLSDDLKSSLLGGDLGLYIDVAQVQEQYGEQIEQARQGLMGALDQAAKQAANPHLMDSARGMYDRFFEALKHAQGLALHLDFAEAGLQVAGLLTVKPDSPAARKLAEARTGNAAMLATLPADAVYYIYMNADAETVQRLQRLGLAVLFSQGEPKSPEAQKALQQIRDAGAQELAGATTFGEGGLQSLNVVKVSDPKSLVAASTSFNKALNAEGNSDVIKSVAVEENALTYKGFTLNHSTMTMDVEKLVQAQPNNPNAAASVKAFLGGDTIQMWYGTNGEVYLQVIAPSEQVAKERIDSYLDKSRGVGATPGFQKLRALLPETVSSAFFLNAQGLVRQIVSQISAASPKNADLTVPADMPKPPALLGGALTTSKQGYRFQFALPSDVGPVIEKGLVPVIQQVQGAGNP